MTDKIVTSSVMLVLLVAGVLQIWPLVPSEWRSGSDRQQQQQRRQLATGLALGSLPLWQIWYEAIFGNGFGLLIVLQLLLVWLSVLALGILCFLGKRRSIGSGLLAMFLLTPVLASLGLVGIFLVRP